MEVIYGLPNSTPENEKDMISLLHQANTVKSSYKLIAGAFSFPNIDWDNLSYGPSADNFMEAVFELDLSQHIL